MPVKTLKWYAGEFDKACALACVYQCSLTLDQFCASRGLEEQDRDQLEEYFIKAHLY